MLADLKSHFRLCERRIYVIGFSNGASMAFRIARELSQQIAAAAPVAGVDWLSSTRPSRPVPILYTIDGHGHHWPGGKSLLPARLAGPNAASLKATDVIWDFFKTHSLAAGGKGQEAGRGGRIVGASSQAVS